MKLDVINRHLFSISHKKPPPLKHILALPTLGQECLRSETELIEKVNFDLGHPVGIGRYSKKKRLLGIGIKQMIQTLTKLMKVMKKGL